MKCGRDRAMFLFFKEVQELAKKRGLVVSAADGDVSVNIWDRRDGGDRIDMSFIPVERPKEWTWNGKPTRCGICDDGPCMAKQMPPGMPLMHDSSCLEGTLAITKSTLILSPPQYFGDSSVVNIIDADRISKLESRVEKLEEKQYKFEREIDE